MQKYKIVYIYGNRYSVQDIETGDNVFISYSKSEAIGESQRLNNYSPIDGDEQTYAKQTSPA